jgi:4-carboxymuconolactone decarboxylase
LASHCAVCFDFVNFSDKPGGAADACSGRAWARGLSWHDQTAKEQEMAVKPNPSREAVRAVVPRMIELSETVIYGDIWERPGLSKRDRSLIVVAALIASYRPEQLRGHLGRALDNGVTKEEIAEIITHLAFYSGWPGSMTAARIAKEVYDERGLL